MKKQKKLYVLAVAASLIILFSVGSANAAWMSEATVNWVSATPDGNYQFRANVDTWTKTYTIVSTDANANAMLATVLTAHASNRSITIEYNGSTIISVYMN